MSTNKKENIEAFKSAVAQLDGLWRSIVIRAGWARIDGVETVIFLHVELSPDLPEQVKRPAVIPSAGEFHAGFEAVPIARLDEVLECLKQDQIKIGGEPVFLRSYGSHNRAWGSDYYYTEYLDYEPTSTKGYEPLRLMSYLGPVLRSDGPLRLKDFTKRWNLLSPPYEGINDVLDEFFDFRGVTRSGEEITVVISAPIPIRFSKKVEFSLGVMRAQVSIAESAERRKLKLNSNIETRDSSRNGGLLVLSEDAWKAAAGHRLYDIVIPSKDISRATMFLAYKDIIVDRSAATNPFPEERNPLLIAHEFFDADAERLHLALVEQAGAQKKGSVGFERAVSWLFGLCGFSVFSYGGGCLNSEIDILAYSIPDRTVLAIECTTDIPENKGKMEKLYSRIEGLKGRLGNSDLKIRPILVTSLPRGQVKPGIDAADRMGIKVLGAEDLREIEEFAIQRLPVSTILDRFFGLEDSQRDRLGVVGGLAGLE